MTSEEKLRAMADALYPLLRDRLMAELRQRPKAAKPSAGKRGRKKDPLAEALYVPELDYMMALYSLRNERRHGVYTHDGHVRMDKEYDPSRTYFCASIRAPGIENVIVPTSTVDIYERAYRILFRHDFRCPTAKAKYCAGISDEKGRKIHSSASAYTFELTKILTPTIIKATRQYWEELPGDDRIVSKAHMLELLDVLEQGQVDTYQQISMWRVLEDYAGKVYTYEEAKALDPMAPERLNPRRIVPTWMGNETD